VADPEFHNGGRSRGGGCATPKKKNEFLPENGGFWCILRLLFYVYVKIGQVNGGRPPAPPSGSATEASASR